MSNTDYFQLTLSASAGNQLSLSTIDATFAGTASFFASPGVTSQFAYSLDGSTFTLIGSPVQSSALTLGQIDLTGVTALQNVDAALTVTLRYYASGQTTTGGWGFTSASASGFGLAIGGIVSPVVIFGPAYHWVGDDATRGDAGTWSQTGGTAWATTNDDVAGTTWDSSKTATFGGSAPTSLVTVSGTVDAAAGISFASTGYTLTSGTINLTGATIADNLVAVSSGTATIASAITGTTGMTISGAGTLVIAGADTHTGGTTITSATLQVGDGAVTGSIAGSVTNNGVLAFNRSDDVTFSGDISGTGNLVKSGSNTLTLGGINSYGGLTTVTNGVLRVNSVTALGAATAGTTVASGAALELIGGVAIGSEGLTLNGNGPAPALSGALRSVSGTNSYAGAIILGSDSAIETDADSLTLSGGITGAAKKITLAGAGDITVSGAIATTSGGLDKNGPGTTTLSGISTFTGATTINAGTLAVSGGSAIADTGTVSVSDAVGAVFKLNASETIGALSGPGGTVDLQANTLTVAGNTSTSFVGTIVGTGGILAKQGTGTLTVSGANTYTGGTIINAGALKVDVGGSLGIGAVTAKGTLLAGDGVTISNSITMSGTPSATLLAGWDFQTTTTGGTAAAAAPGSPLVYVANFGSGTLYLDGTNGSSALTSVGSTPQVTAFSGTTLNAGPGFSTNTSGAAALAIANSSSNGKSVVFKVDMTGLSNLALSYATQRPTTGFTTQTWEYSSDGTTWNPLGTVTAVTQGSFGVQSFAPTAGLDNAATAYVRLTVSGATDTSGNNRFDNIQLTTPGPLVGVGVIGSDGSGISTFSGAITLAAGASVTAASGGTVKITGSISGPGAITKIGAGTVDFTAASVLTGLSKITASAGTTELSSVLGSGTASIAANAAMNIHVSQTLSSLTIGDGAVVTLTSVLPPAPAFDEAAALGGSPLQPVPEPGSAALLFGGALALLGFRRRG